MKVVQAWCLAVVFAFGGVMQAAAQESIRIGVEGAYPPFSFISETGELVGFDIDIARTLCAQMKVKCELVQTNWDGLIPSLNNETVDAVIASVSATEDRRQNVDFTDKYYANAGKLVLKADAAAKINADNLKEQLKGKILGVQTGTIHDRYATQELAGVLKSIERYNTQDEADFDLVAGRVDAVLADEIALASGFLKTDLGKGYAFAAPVFNNPVYYGDGVSIAVRKGDNALRQAFNQAIKAIRANGEYQKINAKYFDFDIY